jgi:6-phosphofructokinase
LNLNSEGEKNMNHLVKAGIDALVIGGDGTQEEYDFNAEFDFGNGYSGTIDNDIFGTSHLLG